MSQGGGDGGAAMSLPKFLSTHQVGTLSVEGRRLMVQQALVVLEQSYALLTFKVARYGINPVQRLRLLQTQLGRPGPLGPEWRFHSELVDIFNSVRDLHTRYVLPQPFGAAVAMLPFLLKEFTRTAGCATSSGGAPRTRQSSTRASASASRSPTGTASPSPARSSVTPNGSPAPTLPPGMPAPSTASRSARWASARRPTTTG